MHTKSPSYFLLKKLYLIFFSLTKAISLIFHIKTHNVAFQYMYMMCTDHRVTNVSRPLTLTLPYSTCLRHGCFVNEVLPTILCNTRNCFLNLSLTRYLFSLTYLKGEEITAACVECSEMGQLGRERWEREMFYLPFNVCRKREGCPSTLPVLMWSQQGEQLQCPAPGSQWGAIYPGGGFIWLIETPIRFMKRRLSVASIWWPKASYLPVPFHCLLRDFWLLI